MEDSVSRKSRLMNLEADDLEINNLPNRLTIFRVLLIPFVVGALFLAGSPIEVFQEQTNLLGWFAGWIFTVAAITDFFDGYIARKKNIVTVFGSFLDPIADKFLVVSSLIMLLYLGRVHAIIVIVLVLREMYMTSLRLLANNEGINVPVNDMGKWKTATQMVAIPMLMIHETWNYIPFSLIGTILIYVACALSIISALSYSLNVIVKLKDLRKIRKQKRKERKLNKENE